MSRYEVFRVVGSGDVQELICQTLEFPEPAEEIKEIRKTVIIDNCKVIYDKVIIDGRLRKDIMFKAANAGFPLPGNVGGCGGIVGSVSGPILDLDVDIAFNALIPVPGAHPDDQCVVLEAYVEGEKEEPANILNTGAFTALIDKSVVFLCVKVVRDVVTGLDHDDESGSSDESGDQSGSGRFRHGGKGKKRKQDHHGLCPKRPTTGFFQGVGIPSPKPGPFPGTWVGPTLIFAGTLNPGIPSAFPFPNTIVNNRGTLVQITAGPGGGGHSD